MDRHDALLVGGAVVVIGGFLAADHDIRNLVQRHTSPSGQDVAEGFNTLGNPATLLGLNAGVIAIGVVRESYGGDDRLKEAGLVSLEAEIFAVAATAALKGITGRASPDKQQGTMHFRPFSRVGSFPSTHAAASFAVATVYSDRFEAPVKWLAYGLAAAVGFSRVYSDEHFASDVVAGSLIGWGMGKFLSHRHVEKPLQWQAWPMVAMEHSVGVGLEVSRHF